MAEFVANFELNNNSIDASFDLSEGASFDALFEVYASGTTWGNISGNIENQTDLQEALSELSGNIGELENTVTDNYNELSGAIDSNHQAISNINSTIEGYGDIVTYDAADFATSAQGAKADTALQPGDDISELNNNEGYITSAAIGDGTLTIQVNNETVGTFTANQSGNTTANIEVPDSATWGNITGDIEDQTDLTTVLDSKQDVLTPGTDIEITQNNTINFTNSSGYITGISGTDVTNALGYTPYNATNPDKFIKNTATGTNSITVDGTATSSSQAINIGKGSSATRNNAVALGYNASAAGSSSVAIGNSAGASTAGISGVAIGDGAKSQAQYAIQLGKGTNTVASTLSVGFGSSNYTLLNGSTGLIPNGRLSTGIARTSDMNAADDELQAQIDNLKARGRFLALWNCSTGLAETNPVSSPYTYQTGDYFIVGVVSTATPAVNYRPDGSSYTTGVASTTVETSAVDVDDVYYYDGSTWHLQINTQKTTAFVNIAGSPYDNIELAQALNSKADDSDITNLETEISAKQDALTPGTDIEIVTGGSLVPLPAGYTQVEYITTDGTAYINTGITVAETDTLDFSFTDTSSPTTVMFITGRNASDGQTMYFVSPSSSLIQWKGRPAGVTLAKGLEYNIVLKSGEVTYTNVYGTTTKTFTGGAVSDTGACLIGAGWSGVNTIDSRKFIGNISKWQIIDSNSDLRFNGVPCYNSSDIYGLYDTVSDTFFPSIGANDFTGGNEVVAGTVINFTNASGYITGITSSDVTTALGYTPYDSSNPSGYTNNVGTVVSVNNTLPDVDGNVTISTGGTVDQTYDGTSANAQSGVAIAGAGFLNNTATGTSALTINGTATAKTQAINIGTLSQATGNYGTTVGAYSYANASKASAFGNYARATADRAIQIGQGTNSTADTLQIGFNGTTYQLLDGTTGLIPDARISNNIARTSAIPTSTTVAGWGFITGINSSDVTTALGYTPYNSSNPNGYITSSALSPYVLSSSLATVATSGSYNDLSNKPTIPAAQVNSDWNAVSGVAEILNKPTIPTATSELTNDSGFIGSSDIDNSLKGTLSHTSPVQIVNLGSNKWENIFYGANKYVAVGQTGYISTSSDGTNWTVASSILGNNDWRGGIAYNSNYFVALSADSYISHSNDGVNWDTPYINTNLSTAQNWHSLVYDGTKFVAMSNAGYVSTSADGYTWNQAAVVSNLSNSRGLYMGYGNGEFIAIDQDGKIATSNDGTNWTIPTRTNLFASYAHSIVYCNGRFVVLCEYGEIYTSFDGENWIYATDLQQSSTYGNWKSLAVNSNQILAISEKGYIASLQISSQLSPSFPYVINSGFISNTYFREWSDGTLEQWNYRLTSSSAGAQTVTYPIEFSNEPLLLTTYTLATSATTSTTTRNYGYTTSKTGFTVYLAANARVAWYAKGVLWN